MALVDLIRRAAGPGRIRGIGLSIWQAALADPRRAGATLRHRLRDARALHSAERRLVADLLYDLIRHGPVLEAALGTDAPEALWSGALVWHGLPPPDAFPPDLTTARARATAGLDPREALARVAAVPAPIADALIQAFGTRALAFVDASNARAPLDLRAAGDRDALVQRLRREGVDAHPAPHAPRGVRVAGRPQLQALSSFREGLFEVQDEGSQLLAELVDPVGTVVDLCAGAGGKTLALARPGVQLIASDVRARALEELRTRARRAGVRVRVCAPADLVDLRADRVLVDVPCSGSGTWRRHPELRWRLDDLERLGALQRSLLDRGAALVRQGGRLIYGTCSVLPGENEAAVDDFLARHPGFLPGPTLRVAPHTHDTDGFFGAVLERVR